MKYKVTKMDRRHTGNHKFKYYVSVKLTRLSTFGDFNSYREWCWNTWGPSMELKWATLDDAPTWAWMTEFNQLRIYLKSEKELAWFQLKWSSEQ
jgi:hypothetical protein